MFQIGGGAGGNIALPMFRIVDQKAFLAEGRWNFEGTIAIRKGRKRPWGFRLQLWLTSETGYGDRIQLETVNAVVLAIWRIGGQNP